MADDATPAGNIVISAKVAAGIAAAAGSMLAGPATAIVMLALVGLGQAPPEEPDWAYSVKLVDEDGNPQTHWFDSVREYKELIDDGYLPRAKGP